VAECVIVYQHSHYWDRGDWRRTPEWQKRWARRCIDAGATAFVGHGVPLLHGLEIYRGRPQLVDDGGPRGGYEAQMILANLRDISREYGTRIAIREGRGQVELVEP